MSAVPKKRVHKTNIQKTVQKSYIKECLKLLHSDGFPPVFWEGFKEELQLKPNLGDNIQFELHKYCQKDFTKIDVDVVIKLVEMCYSPESVSHFTNIGRFVGCVYYISNYLLKKEKYEPALNAINSLWIKEKEIVNYSKEKSDVRIYLYNLHSSFIASAVALASKVQSESDIEFINSHRLAIESLKFFTLTSVEQNDAGRKMLKNSALYLQSLKVLNEKYILEFYNTVNDACKILFPKMKSQDYCRYYIHRMTYLDNLDLEEVYVVLEKTLHIVTVILDCPKQIQSALYKILNFFWKNCNEYSWISDEDFSSLNAYTKQSSYKNELYFLLVSNIFTYGAQFLWKKYEKNWLEKFSTFDLQKILETILSYHETYIRDIILYCTKEENPSAACFAYLNSRNLQRIQYTTRLCLKYKVSSPLKLIPMLQRTYRLSMECFKVMKLRTCCKDSADYMWKSAVIHHTNSVEDICRHQPSADDLWFHLRDCCQEILKAVVQPNNKLPFDFNRVKVLFQRWHTANMKLRNYREALFVCMVYCFFYPSEEKDFMSMWIQTKSEAKNDLVEEVITSEIFNTHEENFKEFYGNFSNSSVFLKSVLIMELKAYSTFCSPKTFEQLNAPVNLVIRILKQLERLDLDLWEMALALSFSILFCSSTDTEALPHYLDKKCKEVIQDLVDSKQQDKIQRRNLHTANLTFSLFLFNLKRTERTEGKMDATNVILGYLKRIEMDKVKFGEDVDLNLTCDVIPSSSHLTVKLEMNYVNELNKILQLWNNAFSDGLGGSLSALELDLWLRNLMQVAHLYELMGEYKRSFSAWILFYKIGRLSKNLEATLLGLTHLVENCMDIDESGMKEEADLIQEKLCSEGKEKHFIVEYKLAVASNYLKNKKSKKCLEYLRTTKEILEGMRTTIKSYILSAKFWCLVSQFLAVYKEYKVVFEFPADVDLRVIAFKAFSYANGGGKSDLIKSASQSECIELVLTMLEVNLWAYNLHGAYFQSDFMRFFLDDLYQIVQKLFLPTRTAEMLARLAEVDLICGKISDCQEKVAKLKSIVMDTSLSTKFEKSTSPYLSVPEKRETTISVQRPISPIRFLDEQTQSKEFDVSPIRCYLGDMKSVAIMEHKKNCKCHLCQNLLIQALTMNAFWLEGEIYKLGRSSKHAVEYYNRAMEVLENLQLIREEQKKVLHLQLASALNKVPGELDFKRNFVHFYSAIFLIKYAHFELSNSKTVSESTIETVTKIGKIIQQFSYEGNLLEWAFAELKLTCFLVGKGDLKPPKKSIPLTFETTNIAKTPVLTRNNSSEKIKNFLHLKTIRGKVCTENSDGSSDGTADIVFSDNDEFKTFKKIIQPKKLNFSSLKSEANSKTVKKKVLAPKEICTKSRKLNFDLKEDLSEERKRDELEKPSSVSKRETRQCSLHSELSKKKNLQPVKIYKDSKDEEKPKTATVKISQRRTHKNT